MSVTSRAGTELIGEGQMGTINHHSGTVAIVTLEVGYANYVTAIMNGNHLGDSDRRTWTIKNFTNGFFTYQATSTNPPYRKESTRILIN